MQRDTSTAAAAARIFSRALVSLGLIALAPIPAVAVPLPPPRPADLVAATAETIAPQPTPADNDTLRAQVLASHRVIGEALPPISDKGGCGIAAPLQLEAIVLVDGMKVTLAPEVILRASLASAVADWVRDDLAPAIAEGDRLASIEGTGGYECRSRDSVAGAKLSEHAIGNALDLHALRTKQGKLFVIAPSTDDGDDLKAFRALMKKTACLRFSTVLGPGADAFHTQHLHVDLAVRRNGLHLCQWTLPDIAAKASALATP
jgi:hypothetical protein